MKTANLDKIYGWRLSREFEEKSRHGKNPMKEGQQRQNTDRFLDKLINITNLLNNSGRIRSFILPMFVQVPVVSVSTCFGERPSIILKDSVSH
jgi:hypothetical protein